VLNNYETEMQNRNIQSFDELHQGINNDLSASFIKFAAAGLLTYDIMKKYDRLSKLEEKLFKYVNNLFNEQNLLLLALLKKNYKDNYLSEAKKLVKLAEKEIEIAIIEAKKMIEDINLPISGLTIKDRINKNKQDTFLKIKEIITAALIRGTDLKQLDKEILKALKTSEYKQNRIIQTEMNRVENMAINEVYKQAEKTGLKFKKMWVATMDKKVRDAHKTLNGKYADKDGYFHFNGYKAEFPGGFGVASLDINCRCKTRAVFENN
jgi:SPP1 gp7 family putative phage head morphogenesis protein